VGKDGRERGGEWVGGEKKGCGGVWGGGGGRSL